MNRFAQRHGAIGSTFTPDLAAEAGRPHPDTVPIPYADHVYVLARRRSGIVGYPQPLEYSVRVDPNGPGHVAELVIRDAVNCLVSFVKLDGVALKCVTTAGPEIPATWFRNGHGVFARHAAGRVLDVALRNLGIGIGEPYAEILATFRRGAHWGINCEAGGCVECEWVTACHEYECERSAEMARLCASSRVST